MSTINVLGPVGFNPTGPYDATRTYQKLDVVIYQGSSYVAKSDSIGQLPGDNTEYWLRLAAGGLGYDDIVDNLTSTASDKVLSARQGKVLKDLIDDNVPYHFNSYIQPIFGGNIAIYNKSNYNNYFQEVGDCFNSVIIDFHMVWNSEDSKFDLRTDYYDDTETALNLVNTNGLLLNQKNVNIKALKFHSTKLTTLLSVNPETLLNAYQNEIEYIIDHFTFDFDSIIILNEDDIVENSDYVTLINNCISALRNKYSKPISISKNGIYKIKSIISSIRENLDYYAFNSYGNYSLNGENSTFEDIIKHFDDIKSFAIMLKQEKPIIMTEFGCRGSWESFHNGGSDFTDNGLSRPIALVIESYFKSQLSCVLDEAYYWYCQDATSYVPNLLKSIKKEGSVRHG